MHTLLSPKVEPKRYSGTAAPVVNADAQLVLSIVDYLSSCLYNDSKKCVRLSI